jgi:hypothetical protein
MGKETAHMFVLREGDGGEDQLYVNQHVGDGQGLKDPCCYGTFSRIIEKSLFSVGEISIKSIEKIKSWKRIRYFFKFFDT